MHPFSLNEEEIKQVSGAISLVDANGKIIGTMLSPITSLALENGQLPLFPRLPPGTFTSMMLGEEGGLPLPLPYPLPAPMPASI